VNGTRLTGASPLAHGDEIRIGTLRLVVHISTGRTVTRTVEDKRVTRGSASQSAGDVSEQASSFQPLARIDSLDSEWMRCQFTSRSIAAESPRLRRLLVRPEPGRERSRVSPNQPAGRVARFGAFDLDARTGELRKRGVRVRLQEQPFQLLAILVERAGGLVTRDEIRLRLWTTSTTIAFDQAVNTRSPRSGSRSATPPRARAS